MSRRRRRRGGANLLTALMMLVALGGGDVAVDGCSKRRLFFFFSFVSVCFFFPRFFFLLFLHPFSVFPFPLLLVPSHPFVSLPSVSVYLSFFLWFVLFFFFPHSLCLSLSLFCFPCFFFPPPYSRPVEWGIYMIGEARATLPLSNHGDKIGWLGWPLCSRLSRRV